MKKIALGITVSVLFATLLCMSCDKDEISELPYIQGLTMDNYPRIDGSTSTEPLNYIIAAKLLGLEYEWAMNTVSFKNPFELPDYFRNKFQCSQTHNAIINLIDNQTDLIIVARKMSADEKQYANNAGVSLIETPIAIDALDFILNSQNSVNSLSVEQIQNIYLGNITNWNEVGGANEEIIPFIRNANSGSQEMMNEIVMNNVGMPDWTVSYSDELTLFSMDIVYSELLAHVNGICFTPHYYKEYMVPDNTGLNYVKTLAVNGIMPNKNSIKNKTYPVVANVYVSIRSDLDSNSMAYSLYELLQSKSGKEVIAESGYVPY
jgi:phosphate transport system substrate-binding protein